MRSNTLSIIIGAALIGALTISINSDSAASSREPAGLSHTLGGKESSMSKVLTRRHGPRRANGNAARELWRVHGRDHETRRDRALGYLVTDGGVAVAYVHQLGLASLRLAVRIRAGAEPDHPAEDLRKAFPAVLSGYLLIPVRSDGHAIGNAPFPAAMFTLFRFDEGEKLELRRFTAGGFEELKQKTAARAASNAEEPGIFTHAGLAELLRKCADQVPDHRPIDLLDGWLYDNGRRVVMQVSGDRLRFSSAAGPERIARAWRRFRNQQKSGTPDTSNAAQPASKSSDEKAVRRPL